MNNSVCALDQLLEVDGLNLSVVGVQFEVSSFVGVLEQLGNVTVSLSAFAGVSVEPGSGTVNAFVGVLE